MTRDGLAEADARARLAAQFPIDEKVRRARYVIRTDGNYAETDAEIQRVYERLLNL
jgi:dephospho-CoA kinase